MSNYQRGYEFEQRTRKYLQSLGYTVWRQGKSAFPDLIAVGKEGTLKLVECKTDGRIDWDEILAAKILMERTKSEFFMAFKDKRKLRFMRLGDYLKFRGWKNARKYRNGEKEKCKLEKI